MGICLGKENVAESKLLVEEKSTENEEIRKG